MPPDTRSPAAFSAASLARRWGCSRRSIYNMVADGRLKKMPLGSMVRISAAEVARVEAANLSAANHDVGIPTSPCSIEKIAADIPYLPPVLPFGER